MKYIEICKGLNDRGTIDLAGKIKPERRDHEMYISLFPFDNTIVDYVKINKSIKGHKGKHYCDYILIDIDNEENREGSRLSAINVVKKIQSLWGIRPDELFIWFSGNKGFHIALVSKLYGQLDPSETISETVKDFVSEHFSDVPFVDLKIYETHRIIRVENSINDKTKLYKIQLSWDELQNLSIDEIRELAKSPRELSRAILYADIRFSEHLSRDLKTKKAFNNNQVLSESGFFLPTNKGNRNNQLFKQACMLFNTSDLSVKSVTEIITSINIASGSPVPEHELQSLVYSASTRSTRKKEETEPLRIKTLMDILPEWLDYVSPENNKISMIFDSLNNEFKGKLRGRLGVVLGYGGSKKSLLGQNFAFDNVINNKNKTVYSNMEMSNAMLFERFLDIFMDGDYSFPSDELERLFLQGKPVEPELKQMLFESISDNILICDNANMTADRYRDLFRQVNEKIDILIVDGMSMMGGNGSEMEKANQHSKELKELAKEENILVLAIVHASKGESLETRDLSKKARASEKIMDNCDFVMTLSLEPDKERPGMYLDNVGFYHCWNKRGTGRRIEKSFQFGNKNLRMYETSRSDTITGL